MRRVLTSALLLCALALPVMAQDQPSTPPAESSQRGEGRGPRKPDPMRQALEQLNLSTQQKEQVQQIMGRNKATFQQFGDLRRQMKEAREKNDEAAIQQIQQEMKDLKPQMKAAMEQNRTDILKILTPEQRQKFEAMKPQHPEREG